MTQTERPRVKATRGTILIVEDDPATAELIRETLAGSGYKLVTAVEGQQALRLVREHRPRLITLDLGLPGVDGRSFLMSLRSDEASKHTPVIVLSASSENLNTFERRTVSGVLPKPFDIDDLRSTVRRMAVTA